MLPVPPTQVALLDEDLEPEVEAEFEASQKITILLGLCGKTRPPGRFACDSSMGIGGAPSAGGPKERWGAAARSMATNFKVS